MGEYVLYREIDTGLSLVSLYVSINIVMYAPIGHALFGLVFPYNFLLLFPYQNPSKSNLISMQKL